jgi:tRNA pseudouridine synthase 10
MIENTTANFPPVEELAEIYVEHIVNRVKDYEFKSFLLGVGKIYDWDYGRALKRTVGVALCYAWEKEERDVNWDAPEMVLLLRGISEDGVKVAVKPKSLFLYGRYRKLERGLSQTRWVCQRCKGKGCERCEQRGRFYSNSVQECIAHAVCPKFRSTNLGFFHGMGREDVDVQMLGEGRPFVYEILKPKARELDLKDLERSANKEMAGSVEIMQLAIATPKAPARIKAVTPDKSYRAFCKYLDGTPSDEKVKELEGFFQSRMLEQRTPQRVSRRRADLVRKREVRSLTIESKNAEGLMLHIRSQSGTYIKELISSDEGRTNPSVSDFLGVPCICAELDVLDIHIENSEVLDHQEIIEGATALTCSLETPEQRLQGTQASSQSNETRMVELPTPPETNSESPSE